MADMPFTKSRGNWDPGAGPKESSGRVDELMATTAKDAPDTCNADNELKQFTGKSGKPPGMLGSKGKEF